MSKNVTEALPQNTAELLTVEQFAKLLKVSRTTVFSWLNSGELLEGVHYIRLGRILRFRWVVDLLFRKKAPAVKKQEQKKRPKTQARRSSPATSAINLNYGALTV